MIDLIKHLFKKTNKEENKEKKYVLWILSEHHEGGYSSRLHNWSGNPYFTYEDALKEKSKLEKIMANLAGKGIYKKVEIKIEEGTVLDK